MELRLKNNGFECYHKVFSTTISKETSQETVVTDTMPDITSVITTEGGVLIRSKDVSDGRIRLEANIPAKVSYVPEDEANIRCLNVNIPVYFSVDNENIKEGSKCNVGLTLMMLETKVLNPRKITVNAVIEASLDCYEAGEEQFYLLDDEGSRFVHARDQELEINMVRCATEKTFVLTDEFLLPIEATPAEEIIGHNATFSVEELKSAGKKLIVRGTVHSRILYRSGDYVPDAAEFDTSFSQIVDTDCDTEDANVFLDFLLSGQYFDIAPGFDGRSLTMELHAVAQIVLSRKEKVRFISDAYSNSRTLEICCTQRRLEMIRREAVLHDTFRCEFESAEQIGEVLAVSTEPVSVRMDDTTVCMSIRTKLYCRNTEGKLKVVQKTVPFTFQAQLEQGDVFRIGSIRFSEPHTSVEGNRAELRATAETKGVICADFEINPVASISYDEDRTVDLSDLPSLVIMRGNSSDDLWQLAKDNHSSVDTIIETNGLSDEGDTWEKLLLIPRTV